MSYIRGQWAYAACDLMDWLKSELDISASVGYAANAKKRNNTLNVECKRAGDVARVPKKWNGYTLAASVWSEPDIVCRRK